MTCNENLHLTGDRKAVDDLRGRLARGMLSSVAGDTCGKAHVELRSVGARWQVTLTVGDERVERMVETLADAAVWIESWLLPLASAEPAPREVDTTKTNGVSPTPTTVAIGPARPEPEIVVVHPGARLSVLGAGAVSNDGALWAGGELSAQIPVSRYVWLGAALGGAFDTKVSGPIEGSGDLRRGVVRATARAGSEFDLSEFAQLRVGGGLGVDSAWVVRVFENDDADKGRGGVLVESLAQVSSPLVNNLSLSTGLVLRGHVVRFGTGGLEPEEESLPEPLPAWHAELQLGLDFAVGGGP